MDQINVALIGNPNTGKSSLFNAITGLQQKTGNYPGITVDKFIGYLKNTNGDTIQLIDLPGTYSLLPTSLDEEVTFNTLSNPSSADYPNAIIYIADATNLKKNLPLLIQLIQLRIPILFVINMIDEVAKLGIKLDIKGLSQRLNIPILTTNARKGEGVEGIKEYLGQLKSEKISLSVPVDLLIPTVPFFDGTVLDENPYLAQLKAHYHLKYPLKNEENYNFLLSSKSENGLDYGELLRQDILKRHQISNLIYNEFVKVPDTKSPSKIRQEKADRILTHPFWGYFIFLGILFVIFQSIFSLANVPMDLIENGFNVLKAFFENLLPKNRITDVFVNAILDGLGGILIFIPQIAFLFLFITILEDSGYLARVAFMFDRLMRKIGLSGKSIIPLISGTACAVPSIMATRNIENKKARLITILVLPFMSCSARIPVYTLMIGLLSYQYNFLGFINLQGILLFGLYLLGFFAVIISAFILSKLLKNEKKQFFIMELPVYRYPNWKNVSVTVYNKVKAFVFDAGKIIIAISIILWVLKEYAPEGKFKAIDNKYQPEIVKYQNDSAETKRINLQIRAEKLQSSYAGLIGKTIEPVIQPIGFDWKIGIALIASFAAREVFVSTMFSIYGFEDDDSDGQKQKLSDALKKSVNTTTGAKTYSLATIASLLVFYAFAMQCMSTLAVTYRETKSFWWTVFQFTFMTGVAYLSSLGVYEWLK